MFAIFHFFSYFKNVIGQLLQNLIQLYSWVSVENKILEVGHRFCIPIRQRTVIANFMSVNFNNSINWLTCCRFYYSFEPKREKARRRERINPSISQPSRPSRSHRLKGNLPRPAITGGINGVDRQLGKVMIEIMGHIFTDAVK